jgi:plasmid maintenance system antidote protein VapI
MSFQSDTRQLLPSAGHNFRDRLSQVLRGIGATAKELSRAADKTPKAAERWLAGDNSMSAETLIQLAREFDEVWEFVCEQTGRDQATAAEMLDQLEALLKARRTA